MIQGTRLLFVPPAVLFKTSLFAGKGKSFLFFPILEDFSAKNSCPKGAT